MRVGRLLVAMGLAIVTLGCTPKNLKLAAPNLIFPEEVADMGGHAAATNGELLISSLATYRRKAMSLESPFTTKGKFGRTDYAITLPAGRYSLKKKTNSSDLYYSDTSILFKGAGGSSGYVIGGIAKDANSNLSVFWCPLSRAPKCFFDNMTDVPPVIDTPYAEQQTTDGFTATISYLGLVQGQMRFVYNEYVDSRIRASFTQEFSFDYVLGKELAFKDARFVVNRATVNDIDITILHRL